MKQKIYYSLAYNIKLSVEHLVSATTLFWSEQKLSHEMNEMIHVVCKKFEAIAK